MLEVLFCALFTIFPDYLYRRYVQGKRIGHEINIYTVWVELRWGLTACFVLTVSLLTTIFYFHPATHSVAAIYRTVSIIPETSGRVAETFVSLNDEVEAGAPLFRLDSSEQEAALDAAHRRIDEIDAEMAVAQTELAAAEGLIQQVQGTYKTAVEELATKVELQRRESGTVAVREIERLQNTVSGLEGAVNSAIANRETVEARIDTLLPAQRASAEAALHQAQVELDKTVIHASIDGTVQQFTLRPGEIVNPLRPAGILVPGRDEMALLAGFNQIEADVIKVGMIGEVTCAAKPFKVIPVVFAVVQDVIAAGQLRATDQLIDVQAVSQSGTITAYMLPLYPGGFDGIPLGSSACIANAYTSNHDRFATEEMSTATFVFLHAVDAVGMVHAIILRLQALLLPVTTLVLGGH